MNRTQFGFEKKMQCGMRFLKNYLNHINQKYKNDALIQWAKIGT